MIHRELIIEESISDVFRTFNADIGLDDSQHCINDQRYNYNYTSRYVGLNRCCYGYHDLIEKSRHTFNADVGLDDSQHCVNAEK